MEGHEKQTSDYRFGGAARPFTVTICERMEQIRVISMPNDDVEILFELPESIRGTH